MSAASKCRRNGWVAGTVIEGTEYTVVTRIEITAVGDHWILARCVAQNGKPYPGRECMWTLRYRDWREVKS